jgi:hypothetical protein
MPRLRNSMILAIMAMFAMLSIPVSAHAADTAGVSKAIYTSDSTPSNGLFQTVASQICCYNGNRPFMSTKSGCRNVGGEMVSINTCYNTAPAARVCCKRGRADWWVRSPRACRNQGGVVVRDAFCRNY